MDKEDNMFKREPLHIYECHVKGATKLCPYIPEYKRGKFLGLCDEFMISHLKSLDINTVQIMPITKKYKSYWGYDVVAFDKHEESYGTEDELKLMVKTLQDNGIEVVLDLVFNHSAIPIEGVTYYDWDVTGCGYCVDVKASLDVIIPAIRYWLREINASGIRYDLAGVLGREGGNFNPDAEFFKLVEKEFSDKIHIAEPYDLGEQDLGRFPEHWYELNHHCRDTIRYGFPYKDESVISKERAVNYVICHDSFTLEDFVSFNEKHNEVNGEDGRDGNDDNKSYNHGFEGYTEDLEINANRQEHKKWLIDTLKECSINWLVLAGDEIGNTQNGNNNPWRFDKEFAWVDWSKYNKYFKGEKQ
jgi:isoamylase